MASLLIAGGLAGGLGTIGYLLNNLLDDNTDTNHTKINQDMVGRTKKFMETKKGGDYSYIQEKIENPQEDTPASTNFFDIKEHKQLAQVKKFESGTIVSPLTGVPLSTEEWNTNDQGVKIQKFYGGRVTQNVDLDKKHANLAWMTGTDDDLMRNKEIAKNMFAPSKNMSNVNGASIYGSDLKHRYNSSRYTNGERPFEQIQVGPGLNKGYTSEGSGGHQQSDTRDYVMPKTVNQLRALNNPKLTYKSRVAAPKKSIDSRGKLGLMFKNKVDTTYNQSHEDLLVTTGAVLKEAGRSTIIIKNTNRQISHNIMGNAKYNVDSTAVPGNYKKSNKLTYCNDQARNLNGEYIGQNETDDYGKDSFFLDINKRNITELRTHTTNVMKVVKAMVTPITDLFKTTIKETTEANSNMGNVGQQVFRTIMKDKDNLQLNTTGRETLRDEDTYRNANSKDKHSYVLDPKNVMKRTIKQTTANNNYIGPGISKDVSNGYTLFDKDAHQTSGSREETLEGREPTNSNVSLSYGASDIHVTTGKHNCDYTNDRGLIKTTMNYIGNNIEQIKNTQTRSKDMTNSARDNLNVLEQLKNNPYNISK